MEGLFISFEGTEGSGKTTIISMVKEYLINKCYNVITTREPGGSKIAEQIRGIILDNNNIEMDSVTEAMLYAASRRQHLVEKVIPYLEKGYIVLCDRYIDSSLAYQGHARNIGIDKVYEMNKLATNNLMPNLTIYINLEPEIGLRRIQSNNREQNRLDKENINFHKKVYEGYDIVKNMFASRVKEVNGNQDIQKVFLDTVAIINQYL